MDYIAVIDLRNGKVIDEFPKEMDDVASERFGALPPPNLAPLIPRAQTFVQRTVDPNCPFFASKLSLAVLSQLLNRGPETESLMATVTAAL
jgi:hypothetical protein